MNLIELVEQARAVVRVWENGRLVDVVLVRYPVCYPEMLTCSSELVVDRLDVVYPVGAEIDTTWSIDVASPIVLNRAPRLHVDLSNRHGRGAL